MWNSPVLLSRLSKVLFGLALCFGILVVITMIQGSPVSGLLEPMVYGVALLGVVFGQLSTLMAANEALRSEVKSMQAKIDKIESRLQYRPGL